MYFFFQAEDGIRDKLVTGVQTCALPILRSANPAGVNSSASSSAVSRLVACWRNASSCVLSTAAQGEAGAGASRLPTRSEERRVGKERRSRWSQDHSKKNTHTKKGRECEP